MKTKTNIKAGALRWNHNETQLQRTRGFKVKSGVKAGPAYATAYARAYATNHNETQAQSRGFKVKSGVKAGPEQCPQCRGDLINNTTYG